MVNKYPGYCNECEGRVIAGGGELTKTASGWIITCWECAKAEEDYNEDQANGFHANQGHGRKCDCESCLEGRSAEHFENMAYGRD